MRRILSALCLSTALGLTAVPAHAADGPVTPTAPTVVDECGLGQDRVSIPDITGVQYLYELDGITVELTPGAYAGIAFIPWDEVYGEDEDLPEIDIDDPLALPDAAATITAEALDGYALTDGASTSFDISLSSTPCAGSEVPVTATTTCDSITFTNPAGNPDALVYWGDEDSEEPQTVTVPAGGERTVHPEAGEIFWYAEDASLDGFGWTTTAPATTPDEVTTEQDRRDLIETAELLDLVMAPSLGDGLVDVGTCAAPTEDDSTSTPTTTPTTPEIPAVVQTDGVEQVSPAAPLLLGGLTALITWSVVRPRRQS